MNALKQAIIERKLKVKVLSDKKMRYATVLLHKHRQHVEKHVLNPIMGRDGWYCVGDVCWAECKGKALIASKGSFVHELDVHIGLWDLRYTEADKEYLMEVMYPTDRQIRELDQIFAAEDHLTNEYHRRTRTLRINKGVIANV